MTLRTKPIRSLGGMELGLVDPTRPRSLPLAAGVRPVSLPADDFIDKRLT
jgi:hypothetical protein